MNVNVGIIGLGYWGPNIVRNCLQISGLNVVALCDIDKNKMDEIAKIYNLNCILTTNYEDLLNDQNVNAIIIVTPVKTHYKLAKNALEKNKHVLVEKPLTTNYNKAEELVNYAKNKSLKLMCDHTYCFHSIVSYLKNELYKSEYGKILYINSTRINLGLFQNDINVIWDLAPHDISIILSLLNNKKIKSVTCSAHDPVGVNLESIAHIDIVFENNVVANIYLNWLSPVKSRNITIGCEKKMIVWDDNNIVEKVKIYNKGIDVDNNSKQKLIVTYRNGDIISPKIDETEALNNMLLTFYNSIANDDEQLCNSELTLNTIKIIELAIISHSEKKTIFCL